MAQFSYTGGPLDGLEAYPSTMPLGNGPLYRLYFGWDGTCGVWRPYDYDSPYWQPHKIAEYRGTEGKFRFRRFIWVAR